MTNPERFRPSSSYVYAAVSFLLVVGMLLTTLRHGGIEDILTAAAFGLAVCMAAYLVFLRPTVTVFDEGLTIVNPTEVLTVGWQDVELIDARYTMFVEFDGGQKVHAWAVSAPGRHGARRVGGDGRPYGASASAEGTMRHVESPRSETGAALVTARRRKDLFDASARPAQVGTTRTKQPGAVAVMVTALSATLVLLVL